MGSFQSPVRLTTKNKKESGAWLMGLSGVCYGNQLSPCILLQRGVVLENLLPLSYLKHCPQRSLSLAFNPQPGLELA